MVEHEYFIDTSAFIALIYEEDQYHDEAVQIQEELLRNATPAILYSCGSGVPSEKNRAGVEAFFAATHRRTPQTLCS
jgi:predicted nucleic acid-binding protein